jgi:hypothetical protein
MADSTYLKHVVEPYVVRWVSERIGSTLRPHQTAVGPRADGDLVHFAFDGVSNDGQIGLLVSTSLTVKPGGVRKLHVDAAILLNAPFQRRLMAFISEDVLANFVNKCDGLLQLNRIEMLVCDSLSAEMSTRITEFQKRAKAEVGDKGKIWKPGGKRR